VRARVLRSDPDDAVPVLPLLFVGDHCVLPHEPHTDPVAAAAAVADGRTALVADITTARLALARLGLDPDTAADRITYARRSPR